MSEQSAASGQRNDRPVPPLTDAIQAQARKSPGTWIYSVDPGYDPDGAVPGYAVLGAWPVDEDGEPGTFIPNPQYRPSPAGLGLSAPRDATEAVMQAAATGHGSQAHVLDVLAGRTVYLPVNADGELVAYRGASGEFVAVFTDAAKVPATAPQLLPVELDGLLESLPQEIAVVINPGSEVSLEVSSTQLRWALADRQTDTTATVPDIPMKGLGLGSA